jgi:putative oxidoreductase
MEFISPKLLPLLISWIPNPITAAVFISVIYLLFSVHTAELFLLNDNGGWQLELLGLYPRCTDTVLLLVVENAASSSNRWEL